MNLPSPTSPVSDAPAAAGIQVVTDTLILSIFILLNVKLIFVGRSLVMWENVYIEFFFNPFYIYVSMNQLVPSTKYGHLSVHPSEVQSRGSVAYMQHLSL